MIRQSRRVPTQKNDSEVPVQRRRATTVAPEGGLVLADSTANSRLLVYVLGNFLHRIERERAEVYFGDLDLARVAEIIGMAGVEPGMRDAGFRARHRSFASVVGVEGQRAVNATQPEASARARRHHREGSRPLRAAAGDAAGAGTGDGLRPRHPANRAVHERVPRTRRGALGQRPARPAEVSTTKTGRVSR